MLYFVVHLKTSSKAKRNTFKLVISWIELVELFSYTEPYSVIISRFSES